MIRALDRLRSVLGIRSGAGADPGYGGLDVLVEALRGVLTNSGIRITAGRAMEIPAVASCVTLLSESVSTLPLIVYERQPDGGRRRATEHALYPILHHRMSQRLTSVEARSLMQADVELRGNAFALRVVVRNRLEQLIPIPARRMRVDEDDLGRLSYHVTQKNGREREYRPEQIFHLRGPGGDGICGRDVVHDHRELLGLAWTLEAYLAYSFKNGVRLSGVLRKPEGSLSDKAYSRLKSWLDDDYEGVTSAGKAMILEEGLEWITASQTHDEAKIVELRNDLVAEIARVFGVPLHKLAANIAQPRANMEQQAREFIESSLRSRLTRWEQRILADLFQPGDRFYAEHLLHDLLRGDAESRSKIYRVLIELGVMTPNEARRAENMNPMAGGDTPLRPRNLEAVPATGSRE